MPLFKNGVINFADGAQTSDEFYFSAEALAGVDGRVQVARLVGGASGPSDAPVVS